MGDDTLQLLRHYELRLLRCTLPSLSSTLHHYPPPPSDQSLHLLIDGVLSTIESGRCVEALSLGQELFNGVNLVELVNPNEFYAEIESSVEVFLRKSGDFEMYFRVFVVVSIAVAAFLAFIQTNMIGPVIELPSTPLPWIRIKGGPEWEAWARNELMSVGSDLLGKFSNLQFIIFAKILLTRTRDLLFQEGVLSVGGISSITWWMARVTLLQQRLLHECCSSLFDLLQVFIGQSLHALGNVEKVTSYWGAMLHEDEALNIVSMLHLEAGLIDYTFGRVDSSRKYFESAASVSGLELSLSGALGFRTVHQVEPKAQMVLVVRKSSSDSVTTSPLTNPSLTISAVSNEENSSQNIHGIGSASDVLMTPRLSENSFNGSNGASIIQNGRTSDVNLNANQQAAVLAQCVLLEKSARQDELQRWEMAPYIEAVDSQKMSYFIIRCFCNILRVRWESTRDRTKERALLMMDKVVQDLYEPCPEVHERIRSCFAVYIPTMPALRKEYGELLVSRGLIGEAVKTFEDLELWDNLIYCYCLLEKKAAAVELIKTRLSERPNDPRLWCSLGDVTNDDSCYEKALEVSNDKSARAKRSLARSAYNRGDYEKSKILWESAMALNSLYPDGWFALGAAALKARDIEKALDGFTRAVQLDPENGEAWNNIACLHMIRNKSKEAFIAFKEALKFKRDSWQMWENYSHVAVDIGNLTQAMEALQMVLDLSKNKRVDEQLLGRIMQEMEKRISDSELASTRETVSLMELLGKILRQIVRSSGGGEIWGLYARWLKNKGDLTMYSEALLKQVRSYQGSELWKDVTRFKKFANASLELCKVYMEISSSSGSIKELHAAQMHLRNTLKQANSFSDTEEFKALQDCLDQVKMRLEGYSAAATQHSLETLSL